MRETRVRSLGQEDPLEGGMATHCSILGWRIPRTEEPGGPDLGLQSRTRLGDGLGHQARTRAAPRAAVRSHSAPEFADEKSKAQRGCGTGLGSPNWHVEAWELETLLLLNRVTCLLYQTASAPTLRQGECASSPPNPSPHHIESPGTPGLCSGLEED